MPYPNTADRPGPAGKDTSTQAAQHRESDQQFLSERAETSPEPLAPQGRVKPKINWDDTDEIDHDWTTDDSPEGSEA